MVQLILAFWLLLCTPHVWAATYYVDPSGNNGNAGTEEAPWLTFNHGVSQLIAGDTLYVKNGTYNITSAPRLFRTGTQAAPIKVLAYQNHNPIINFIDSPLAPLFLQFVIQETPGHNKAIAWITVEGLTFTGGAWAIHSYNCQNCTIRRNFFNDQYGSGILINGALDTTIEQNVFYDGGSPERGGHCMYLQGSRYIIRNNLIYGCEKFGVQLNGTLAFDPTDYPNQSFSDTKDAIIEGNTIAYTRNGSGVVVWGIRVTNARIENNIFYENWSAGPTSFPNGVNWIACCSNGVQIRNNHFYASGSGGLQMISGSAVENVNYTQSGNVVNVSPPAFVNGGSNALPASPDFRLTASAPVNIARTNEFLNNSTNVVGAFKTLGNPTASITTKFITLTFPMNVFTPIAIPSATGLSVTCTPNPTACPGSPTIVTAARKIGADTQVDIEIGGIAGNACATGQDWRISYTPGSWADSALLGVSPGLSQKVFAFTNILATNLCTGSGPTSYPAGYQLFYKFDEGTGTNANDESANNLDCTLTNGATWGTGKSGSAMVVAEGTTQHCTIPWGSGVNPTTQSLTIVAPVFIAVGAESATHYVVGPDHGTNQRAYICARSGTWRIALQSTSCSSTAASNLAVVSGWNYLVWRFDSGTDVATLSKDGIAGTGGATSSYTSFTFATNWTLGRVATLTASGGSYDDFLVYLSLQDPATLFAVFQSLQAPVAGTLSQAAVQVQDVYLTEIGGTPINSVPLNAAKKVIAGGAIAAVAQIHCTNVADCDQTAFRWAYRKNGAGVWQQVPNMETADGVYLWGSSSDPILNAGVTTARLTGSCTVTNGVTLLTSAQAPNVDLPQDGCVMLRGIFRFGNIPNEYVEFRIETEGGAAFTGSYTLARFDILDRQAGGVGF